MNKSLLPVPSGIFKILDLSGNDNNNKENSLEFSLVLPTYNEAENIQNIWDDEVESN